MTLQVINVGTYPNDATGDPLQTALTKVNTNFAALNALVTTTSAGWGTPTNASVIGNFPGSAATLAQCGQAISELILVLKAAGLLSA